MDRLRRYSKLANEFAVMDADDLAALGLDRAPTQGWGTSQGTIVGDDGVFVKRVPVTEREYEHLYSTKNLFRLPLYYQYGVGSAGFGVFRELATHVKTTSWVLDGSCARFPMLLHHRIVPRRSPHAAANPDSWVAGGDYVGYWGGSKRIGTYIAERARAPYELWLVLEWVPHVLHEWIVGAGGQDAAGRVVDELVSTVSFLHERGVFHFDAHWGNVVCDDDGGVFLTDFGLANDRAFALSADERAFFDAHVHYDYGETIYSLGAAMVGLVMKLEADARAALVRRYVPEGDRVDQDVVIDFLVRNIDDNPLELSGGYVDAVRRYAEVILFMNSFFASMRANRKKNTPFDDARLRALVLDAGLDV